MPEGYILLQIWFLTGGGPLDSCFVVESAARNAARNFHHNGFSFCYCSWQCLNDRYQD